jgi:HK97 family phage portal protein
MGMFTGGRAQRSSSLATVIDAATGGRGRSAGGSPVPVGWSGSQAIPAALDAVRLRHDLIATMPVQVFRTTKSGRPERIDTPPVLRQPGYAGAPGNLGIISWLAASQKSLDLRGNAYGIIVDRDGRGRPTQIELQHPDAVRPVIRDGRVIYRIAGKPYEARDVWHEISHDEPGSPVGLSPIAATARSLGIQLAAEQFGADFFRDGAHPTAMLMNTKGQTVDGATAAVIKSRFLAAVNGNREPIVVGGDWDYKSLSVAPNESQFLETLQDGVNQVARIFNVPAELIGGGASGSSLTYANRSDRALDFLVYRLGPAILRREAALGQLVGPDEFVKLNRGALLATDLLTRYRSYEIALRNGVLTLDEVRDLEDRPPLTPAEIAALKDAGLLGKPAASPAPTPSTEN